MAQRFRPTRAFGAIFVGLLFIAACSTADPPTETWTGIATSDGFERSVSLELERRGDRRTGEYRVDGIPGEFEGTVAGDVLSAELRASGDCAYALDGTITDDRIDATYAPADCPGGDTGTWALDREP